MLTCFNRINIVLNIDWYSVRRSVDHAWSRCVHVYMYCKGEVFLPLKATSFIHSQSNRNKIDAPTLISVIHLFGISSSQWPLILEHTSGQIQIRRYLDDRPQRANLHRKKRCLILSSWVQKLLVLLPCQFATCEVVFSKHNSSLKLPHQNLHFNVISYFHILLLLSTEISNCITYTDILDYEWLNCS